MYPAIHPPPKEDRGFLAHGVLKLGDKEIKIALNNSSAAKELIGALPHELTIEKLNENEKISYLPNKLKNIEPKGYAPKVGDACYYIPWGNICIFMKDYKYSDDLICLGQVTEGMDIVTGQEGKFTVQVEKQNKHKVLIAYFSWANNTKVTNPKDVDIDASTSASVLVPGNLEKIATVIHNKVGGDVFPIVTVEPYDSDYNKCLNRADKERKQDLRPALTKKVDNIQDYDIIFLGYPNWWGSVPQALYTFIDENDLSNKTIIPFCGHGTGGLGTSEIDLEEHLSKSSKTTKAIGIYRSDTDKAQPKVEAWLKGLGY